MFRDDINVNAVMMEYGISATAARVLFVVNRYVNSSRRNMKKDLRGVAYCYASKERIAQDVGKSRRTIARAIAELKDAGLIESRRTTRNAHIYITYYGLYGTSANATNGTSNNNHKSYNPIDISIYPDKTPAADTKTSDDVNSRRGSAQVETPVATPAAKETNRNTKKGKPTPKRRQRITKAEKNAAKERYRKMIERKLDMANSYYLLPDAEGEYRQLTSLVDLLADTMAVPGRQIRVNGAGLSVEQYWQVVQNISSGAIDGLFDRLNTAAVCTGITNMRAYTLAAVYNAVQWHELTASADIDLYKHTAG